MRLFGDAMGIPGRSWGACGTLLGRPWDALGRVLGSLGPSWDPLETLLGPFWPCLAKNVAQKWGVPDFGPPTGGKIEAKIVKNRC